MDNVYACEPLILPRDMGKSVCVKFVTDKGEVSLALDDSCGAMDTLGRSEIMTTIGNNESFIRRVTVEEIIGELMKLI